MYVCSNGVKTAVILQDANPESPRTSQDNLTKMVCWHRRYNLGDPHSFDDAQEFAENLASEYLNVRDVFKGIHDGLVDGYRLVEVDSARGPYYELQRYGGLPGYEDWRPEGWKVTKDFGLISAGMSMLEDLFESFTTKDLLMLLDASDKVVIQPLYLYDHSGISISTGSFVGRAQHATWDSGQVGYIYLDKETAMRELAMPTDEVRLAIALEGYKAKRVQVPFHLRDVDDIKWKLNRTLLARGFSKVAVGDFVSNAALESADGKRCLELAAEEKLFKKENRLYALDGMNLDGVNVAQSFDLRPVFSFNPGYQPLTEEAWKARAEQVLEADVKEYDNYLTGEVYGYKCFEGLDEVDSCWGFNPGKEDVEDLMNDELRGWFGADMEFQYEAGDDFDVEDFFEENDFPELRGEIRKMVETQLHHTAQRNKSAFPYAVSYEDICWNKDGVLDDVIESLYEEHCVPNEARIHEAFQEFAGISRSAQPKLTVADLDPNKDYTIEELSALMHSKAREHSQVEGLISDAKSRACSHVDREGGKEHLLE